MTAKSDDPRVLVIDPEDTSAGQQSRTPTTLTPAALQSASSLTARRAFMLTISFVTLVAVMIGVGIVLGDGGLGPLEVGLMTCVLLSAPWTILGFWNALIGLGLAIFSKDSAARVAPFLNGADRTITGRVAVAMAIRNEDPEFAFRRMLAIRESLNDTAEGGKFDLHILSDSDDPEIADEEERLFALHSPALSEGGAALYRRREDNSGFKAGNVWDFLQTKGDQYKFFVPLDADSLMSGRAIVRLVRIAEAHPKIGILQSLAVGAPAQSGFGRIFQFGMRHGMRAFTLGSAWWQGDCGPFWGHNAVIRTAPFRAHCELPKLGGTAPWGGDILSHDQLEAVMMRRAGYEVRVVPVESESYEENPVTVLDFIKREQRWCNGNMQYFSLLGMPGLRPTSRFQLVQAIMMYLSAPAWMLLTVLGVTKAVLDSGASFDMPLAITLFAVMVGMSLTPKIVGAAHVVMQQGGLRRYGGARRFALGMAIETIFSILMAPIVALHLTIFLIGLILGRKAGWQGQIRDAYGLQWNTALKALWPQMLLGCALLAALWLSVPNAVWWVLPVLTGLILAAPFAVLSASPMLGQWLTKLRICAIPEEFEDVPILTALNRSQPRKAEKRAAA